MLPWAWLLVFVAAPLVVVAKISLSESAVAQPPYRPRWSWTLDPAAWQAFADGLGLDSYRALLADDLYWRSALASLAIASAATAILVLVGYPVALAMARAPKRLRPVLLAIVILPFWTSFLIRVYAWIAILRPAGLLDAALGLFGLPPLELLNSTPAVLIGIVYAYLPFMVLPIYAVLERRDPALLEAAADLGAGTVATFRTVTLPLSRPGLASGVLLCFVPIFGEFVIPDLLGGSDTLMLGRTLWSEFFGNRDWPLASAVAIVMLLALALPLAWLRESGLRRGDARR
ncbi:MAG: ABC transporter permease [Methylobacteriaceae bacterium]|nr:ABC transporter permease [Methylobacteriaceae bacterium]